MNCSGEDIPDLDLDNDMLISLLGKLSLDAIPNDVSETLEALENRTLVTSLNESAHAQSTTVTYCSSELYDSVKKHQLKGLHKEEASKIEKEKESFLSSIGLVSGKPLRKNITAVNDRHGCLPKQTKDNTSGNTSSKAKAVKKEKSSGSRDSLDFPRQRFCYPAGSFRHKSVKSLQNVFSEQGTVFDLQLSDIDSSFSLPPSFFTDKEEIDFKENTSDNLLQVVHTSENSVRSPDSGYDTSPCPSALSPCSTPFCTESYNLCDHEQTSEDELEGIIAAIVEVENSLTVLEDTPVNQSVPLLKSAKDPKIHKEDILNFLKEPVSLLSSASASVEEEKSSCSEVSVSDCQQNNISVPSLPSKVSKKFSPKTKDHKLGYEFKYAAKNDLCHSSIFTNVKHVSERNKILKQIQEDERAKKHIKVIQLMSKKLKRSAVDDRENKKRRIHYIDSTC